MARTLGEKDQADIIGAGLAGLAGGLFAAVEGFVSPTLIGFLLSTEVLIWTALGGREMLLAAFLGAIVLRWLESSLVGLLGDSWILALGLVLMASVVLLPKGLIATPLERLGRRPDA
jgi:ABC-type branched-subunit amino acid transport system permease subunit